MMGKDFNEKCDVYAFGIILWQMITRKEPFSNHNNFRGKKKKKNFKKKNIFSDFRIAVCQKGERPEMPADCPPTLAALINICWDGKKKKKKN